MKRTRPPVLLSRILEASPDLVTHMADHLGLGLTRGDHFRGLHLDDKLCRFLGRKEWLRFQIRHLSQTDRAQYRATLQELLLDLAPPKLSNDFSDRLLELGLAFMIDEFDGTLIPLEFAFLSDAAWTLKGSLAQALVAYLSQAALSRQLLKSTTSPARALHALASIYVRLRQSWRTQIPGLSLRQLLAIETLQLSPSSQPASRLGSLLGAGSPEVFSWPRYMRYHGSGSQNALQELLLLGLVRPKDLDPGSALRELQISTEAQRPVEKALPTLFRRYGRSVRAISESRLVRSTPPGNLGLDLQRFLVALAMMPPLATKDGTPSMIHVDRLARLMGLPQSYQRFLLALAWDNDWLGGTEQNVNSRIKPTAEAAALVADGPDALRTKALMRFATLPSWDETRASPCRLGNPGPMTHLVGRLRGFLLELTEELKPWTPACGLTSLLISSLPFRRLLASAPDLAPVAEILNTPNDACPPLLESLVTTLWWTQQLEIAKNQAGDLFLSPGLLHDPPPSERKEAETAVLKVAASGEFYLPIDSDLERLKKAAELGDILAVDQACRFRITRNSMAKAKKAGWCGENIRIFLGEDLPQNLLHMIEETFTESVEE